jgi:hypothetical protein
VFRIYFGKLLFYRTPLIQKVSTASPLLQFRPLRDICFSAAVESWLSFARYFDPGVALSVIGIPIFLIRT